MIKNLRPKTLVRGLESVNALLFETVKVYGTCIGNEATVHSAGKGEGGKNNIQKMALKFKHLICFNFETYD